jgi:hypothetical protein
MRRFLDLVFAEIAGIVATPAEMRGITPLAGSWNGLARPYLSTSLRGLNWFPMFMQALYVLFKELVATARFFFVAVVVPSFAPVKRPYSMILNSYLLPLVVSTGLLAGFVPSARNDTMFIEVVFPGA